MSVKEADTGSESKLCSKAALGLEKQVLLLGNHVLIGGGIWRKRERARSRGSTCYSLAPGSPG